MSEEEKRAGDAAAPEKLTLRQRMLRAKQLAEAKKQAEEAAKQAEIEPIKPPESKQQPPQQAQEEEDSDSEVSSHLSGLSEASSDSESQPQADEPPPGLPGRPDSPTSQEQNFRAKIAERLVQSKPISPSSSEASSAQTSSQESSTKSSPKSSPKSSGKSSPTQTTDNSSAPSESGGSSPASGARSPVQSDASSAPEPCGPITSAPLKPIENKITGKDGEKLRVAVNFMKINIKTKKKIHLYAVFFEPNLDSIPLRRKIVNSEFVTSKIGSVYNFTGMNLFLPHKLPEEPCTIAATHPTTQEPVVVTITHVKVPPTDELINFYNNLFNKVMRAMKLVELNNHHYNPTQKIDVPAHKLEVWPGYVCAIQEYDGGLMINVDTSHRVLRKSTAREMMHAIYENDSRGFADKAKKLLIGAIVLTRYNNRAYRVDDIDFTRSPASKFTLKEGQEITFIDYFRQHWGVEIKDMRQPLLLHRPKPRRNQTEESPLICLVPELSYLTGLTDDIRADHRIMKDLASHTKIMPDAKHRRLVEFIQQCNTNPAAKQIIDDWGLEIDPRPTETFCRRLGLEKLGFGNGVEAMSTEKADWAMKLKDSACLVAKPIKRWYFLYSVRDKSKAQEFCSMLLQVSRRLGFSFESPRRIELVDDMANHYRQKLREADKSAELIVVMTPGSSQREDRYAAIKQACIVDLAVPSQVVRCATLTPNKFRAVCVNIALQIVCKQGGQLWSVGMPLGGAMYVGLDSYHDPSNKSRSVVGVVSSLNKGATQWYSKCYWQNRKEEIVNTLGSAMLAALMKYIQVNKEAPTKIFIYRDGVGDGDLMMVRDYEINAIERSVREHLTDMKMPMSKITYVVVQKRVNVKLMYINGRSLGNPPPGSVIDHTVTRRQFYDFYLVSQHVHQGTVTPTHFITLLDECNLGPDRLQKLSYKMCHLYYNWPGTIRVPAPCQYAHKLAFLMGQYVKTKAPESLCDKLYYL